MKQTQRFCTNGINGRRLISLLLVFCLLLPLFPTAMAAEDGEIAELVIEYRLNTAEGAHVAPAYRTHLRVGSSYNVESPNVDGYTLSNSSQQYCEGVLQQDTTLCVLYKSSNQVQYTVNYVVNSVTDANGTSIEAGEQRTLLTETHTGTVDQTVTASIYSFAHYKPQDNQNATLTLTNKPEDNVLTLYYTRTGNVNIYFHTDTGGDYVQSITAQPGDDIAAKLSAIASPSRPGYTFTGWQPELDTFENAMPEVDTVVTAQWQPALAPYSVIYMMQNATGDGYTPLSEAQIEAAKSHLKGITSADAQAAADIMSSTRYGATQTPLTPAATDALLPELSRSLGQYPFAGFTFRETLTEAEQGEILADGTSVLYLYYDRETFSLTLHDRASDGKNDIQFGTNNEIAYPRPNSPDAYCTVSGYYGAATGLDFHKLREHYDSDVVKENLDIDTSRHFVGFHAASETSGTLRSVQFFSTEHIATTGEMHFFPVYSKQDEKVVTVFGESYVTMSNDSTKQISTDIATLSGKDRLTITRKATDGYTWESS